MRSLALILAFLGAALLGGCGILGEPKDETADWSPNKLYATAKEALNDGQYDTAVKYFEKLEARYPYGRYAQQAQVEIAYAYWKSGEPASALAACDRFIKLHPKHPHIDYIYYLKGLINFNEDLGFLAHVSAQDQSERDPKSANESFEALKELVTRFPDSKYTPDAALRMQYLVNALAAHEVHVARYYMKRGAYLAAINRAQYAVKTYQQAPAIEEALFIMVKAYDELAMVDLRDDSLRVMQKNFPDSEYYTKGLTREIPWWKLW